MRLFLLHFYIFLLFCQCFCFNYLSGTFSRISVIKDKSDTVKGQFYYNREKTTVLLEVFYPVHQLFYSTAGKFIIYYPESNIAYKYSGKKGEGMIDFMVNFIEAVNNEPGESQKTVRLVGRQEIRDSIFYSYESKAYNKEGPLFTMDICKHIMQGREYLSTVMVKNQKQDIVGSSKFKDYQFAEDVYYPAVSHLKKQADNESILHVSNLSTTDKWPKGYKRFKIPKGCKTESF